MKTLLVILAIYINYVICENNKYAVKSFPKKVKPYGNGKILINSGKYVYKIKPKPTTQSSKKYTVFQVVGISKTIQGVPDSPYFPVDQTYDQKSRVKKVLPDYAWSSLRSKRSAVLESPPEKKDENKAEVKTTENKPETKATRIVQTSSSPKPIPTLTSQADDIKVQRKSATVIDNKNADPDDSKANTQKEEPEKPIERARTTKTTETVGKTSKTTKKGDSTVEKTNKKPERNSDRKGDVKSNNKDSRSSSLKAKDKDTEAKVANVRAKVKGKEPKGETTKAKVKSKDTDAKENSNKTKLNVGGTNVRLRGKGKNASATNVRAKLKGDAMKVKVTNVRNKKNSTNYRANRAAKRNKDKKLKRKRASNNQTAVRAKGSKIPPRRKNRSRSKKGQKTKSTNGTRAGKKPKAQRRLIGAREALIEDYPYVVSIQKNDQHWCSGALLNPRLAITTANCLWKASRISRMEVRAGSRHLDRGGQMAGIQEVMKHPGWGLRRSPDNDVALILLDRNIRFSDSVHGVDLPNRVMMPPFDDAWVTSWGAERRDGVFDTEATALQVYHTRLMEREKCNNVTMRFSVIVTENFICLSQSGKTAPCTRDTGAPAVSDGILWGLASWGIRKLCGTERFPAVFSYLASHSNLEFITNATRFLMSDQRYYPYGDRYPVKKPKAISSGSSE